MNVAGLRAHRASNDLGEPPRRRERSLAARAQERAGNAAREALLTQHVDDRSKIALARGIDDVGCGRTLAAHSHVEGTVEPEREAALGCAELHRGPADIDHDAR